MDSFESHIHYHPFNERNGNENEKRVVTKIQELFKTYPDCCFCAYCLDDIYNVALNSLPSKYEKIVARHLDKRNPCSDSEIEKAVKDAIAKVHDRPKPSVKHTQFVQSK